MSSRRFLPRQTGGQARHQAAVRGLAFKWIRLLFYLWKTGTIYDENLSIQQLRKRNSPLVKYLENP